MHYSNLVIIERPEEMTQSSIERAVAEAMGPEGTSWWDFYQIGGRWTGCLDGYDPTKDPKNIETCYLCGGTGVRPGGREEFGETWFKACNGCNGCSGTGKSQTSPTTWGFHLGDIVPIETVTEEQLACFHRVVCGYGTFCRQEYVPWLEPVEAKFVKKSLPPLEWLKKEHVGHLAVVVDNHN